MELCATSWLDTRERDLASILGFEHSRAVRWKEGQMYVDRAEYLVRLADALMSNRS